MKKTIHWLLMLGVVSSIFFFTAVATAKEGETIYHGIRPNFVVTIKSESGIASFLLLKLDVVTRSQDVITALKDHDLLIKDRLTAFYIRQKVEELKSMEDKEKLRKVSLETINKALVDAVGFSGVENVLFTEFILE